MEHSAVRVDVWLKSLAEQKDKADQESEGSPSPAVNWFNSIVSSIQLADKVLGRQVGMKVSESGEITFVMGEK